MHPNAAFEQPNGQRERDQNLASTNLGSGLTAPLQCGDARIRYYIKRRIRERRGGGTRCRCGISATGMARRGGPRMMNTLMTTSSVSWTTAVMARCCSEN